MDTISINVRTSSNAPALEIEAVFPEPSGDSSAWEMQLPCWRPGRYELGNFSQYITKMVGVMDNGDEVVLDKTTLHSWEVPAIVSKIRYRFYANILNAGSTFVRSDLQYVNPVNCMVYRVGSEQLGYEITLADVPTEWICATASQKAVEDGKYVLKFRNMQHLMDTPWMVAEQLWHAEYTVKDEEKEVEFHIWSYGMELPNSEKFVADHKAFSLSQISCFNTFPSSHYHFLYLLPPDIEVRHGVEHEDSTVIALGPKETINSDYGYDELISIASHELYHAWNVKRIRPSEWTPYDFKKAAPSKLGYIAEGVTTYMGDLFLFEAGCIDLDNWSRKMEILLSRHLNNPGRLNLSVAQSSYDTWLDGYRPGVPGRKGSIYVEGAVLAFICDCRIMKVTQHKKSLSTAMTLLWERSGKPRLGLTADQFWDTLAEVAGERLDDIREKYADGTHDSYDDLVEAFKFNGLLLEISVESNGKITPKLSALPA